MILTEFDEEVFVKGIKEEGREEGREEGKLIILKSLVEKGIIDIPTAAKEYDITPEEFRKKINN